MEIPHQVQRWIDGGIFPQRVLFSGRGDLISLCTKIASKLQKTEISFIEKGSHGDTAVFRDGGKSFKVDFSAAAQKDDQMEHENARGLIGWANKKPVAPFRIVILENVERAGINAINALLKVLEEPPEKTIFLLTTRNHHALLDTVISRVTVVRVNGEDPEKANLPSFFRTDDVLACFRITEELEKQAKDNPQKRIDRTVFLEFLEGMIQEARLENSVRNFLPLLLETYRSIQQNMNPKLCLERLALRIFDKK